MHHKGLHTSGHQHRQCWQPFHHHSGMEAFHNEADLAPGLELVLEVALEALELVVVLELEEMEVQALVLAAVEDHRMANHTCHPCTSFPSRSQDECCTSSHTGGRECHTEHVLHVFQPGNQLGTQHQTQHTSLHRLHPGHQHGAVFRLLGKEAVHNDHLEQGLELEVLESAGAVALVLAWATAQE